MLHRPHKSPHIPQDDSVLDIFPMLSRPPSYPPAHRQRLFSRFEQILKKISPKNSLSRTLQKLDFLRTVADR